MSVRWRDDCLYVDDSSVLVSSWTHVIIAMDDAGPFYPQDMRDWAQLEHAVQPLLGRTGSPGRDVCPKETHMGLFFNTMGTQVRIAARINDLISA